MIEIKHKKDCCGCESCVQICPKQCITFQQDSQGFFYPLVNQDICINCGLCDKVCPIKNVKEYSLSSDTPVYAAYNKEEEQRMTSSSGGIFQLLASNIIQKNGVVFGAKFDSDWNVIHDFAENLNQIEDLKRSKYVQSRIGSSFKKVKYFLGQGRLVLFIGTPCQVAGLKFYLRKDYPNLLTADVVCHGVPSPMVWQKYLKEKRHEIAMSHEGVNENDVVFKSISFRDKVKSWRKFNLTFKYNICKSGTDKVVDGIMSRYVWEDYYMLSFLHDYANRPSCFDCQFRNGKCQSDLTLADFWSIEKLTDNIELKSDKGTSLIMVHSHKGNKLIGETSCILSPFAFKESFRGNPAVFYNWPKPISHDLFFRECKKSDIKCAYEKAHRLRIVFDSVKKKKNIIVKIIRKVWQK